MLDDVYSTRLLSLSAAIPHLGRLPEPQGSATKHARLCGSVVSADVVLAPTGEVAHFAQDVKACALGQASSAILGNGIIGASGAEVEQARRALRSTLDGEDVDMPARFADLDVFRSVREYRARHGSVMLAFDAACAAIDQALAPADSSSQTAIAG